MLGQLTKCGNLKGMGNLISPVYSMGGDTEPDRPKKPKPKLSKQERRKRNRIARTAKGRKRAIAKVLRTKVKYRQAQEPAANVKAATSKVEALGRPKSLRSQD